MCEWKSEDRAVREAAWGLLEDVMTEWRFGEREGESGGWTEEKPMPTDGMEGGSLLISCPSSLQKISGKQRPWCWSFSQCEDEDVLSGVMEMYGKLCDTACLHDADIVPNVGKSQDVFQKT